MVKFEMSKALGRKLRADDWSQLGKSRSTQALDMIQAGFATDHQERPLQPCAITS